MTALSQSLITFGSYAFPLGAMVKSRDLTSDIEETKMLGFDGTIAPPGLLGAQIITVSIEIGGGGDFDPKSTSMDITYLETLDDLNNALNDLFFQLEQDEQQLTIGYSPARQILAQKRKFTPAYLDGSGRRHATVEMEFYAKDPRWLATTVQTSTTSGATVTNNGNMVSYPVVTYTQTGGGASDPVSLRIPTGSGYVELDLAITLADGDVLVIDCDPRDRAEGIIYTPSGDPPSVRLDLLGTDGITNTIGNDATFPYLLPGNHVPLFLGANAISFAFQDAFAL